MDRVYQSNAVGTPPTATPSSGSFPTAGNKTTGQLATVPGAYWFYSVTEEIRNAIIAAGLTPDPAQVNQLALAIDRFLPLSGGKLSGAIQFANALALSRTADNGHLQILGATSRSKGASIELCGSSNPENAGGFVIRASNGSNDKDLVGLPDGTLNWGTGRVVCVDSWSDGLTWYRKYSDGWIELGGYSTTFSKTSTYAKTLNVTYPIAFSNDSYSIVAMCDSTTTSNFVGYIDKTSTSITLESMVKYSTGGTANKSKSICWYACGY